MITLINGRGQLGESMTELLKEIKPKRDAFIYHTWNVWERTEEVQKNEYIKFKDFVDYNQNKIIVFVSTYSIDKNPYTHYKRLSEEYLIRKNKNGVVVRLPNLIGKGICEKFRDHDVEPFGELEIMTIKDAAEKVINITQNGGAGIYRVRGKKIPASLLKEIIKFGLHGVKNENITCK